MWRKSLNISFTVKSMAAGVGQVQDIVIYVNGRTSDILRTWSIMPQSKPRVNPVQQPCRREKILKKLLRISSRRLLYHSRALWTVAWCFIFVHHHPAISCNGLACIIPYLLAPALRVRNIPISCNKHGCKYITPLYLIYFSVIARPDQRETESERERL